MEIYLIIIEFDPHLSKGGRALFAYKTSMKRFYYTLICALIIISQLLCLVQAQQINTQDTSNLLLDIPVESSAEMPFENTSGNAYLSGSSTTLFSSSLLFGQGTQQDPYLITDKADLEYFRQRINTGYDTEAYFKLTSDIDLGGAEWTPIGFYSEKTGYSACFAGHFDGDGHTISNFKITSAKTRYIGFFGFTFGATIQNLTLSDFSINVSYNGYLYAGSLIGRCIADGNGDTSQIINCKANGSVKATSTGFQVYAGGLCGYIISNAKSSTLIQNSIANVDVSANIITTSTEPIFVYSGGLIGYAGCTNGSETTITSCASSGKVTSFNNTSGAVSAFSGGFIGYAGLGSGIADQSSSFNISKCFSSGQVRTSSLYSSYCGGFIGTYFLFGGNFNISDCYASGNVGGKTLSTIQDNDYTCVGGFTGYAQSYKDNNSVIENCYASGNVADEHSQYSYCGKFAGYNFNTNIQNCYGFDLQIVYGHEIYDQVPTILSGAEYYNSSSYQGFDFESDWEFVLESSHFFPHLKELNHIDSHTPIEITFLNDQETFLYYPFVEYAGKVEPPVSVPEKAQDDTFTYKFKGWSLTPGGEIFNFSLTPVFESTTFHAVFKGSDLSSWNGSIADSFTYGTGTQDDPYLIYTPEELALIAFEVNRGNAMFTRAHYSLKNDIYLGENAWTPIGTAVFPFKGVFIGNGYSISNFEIKQGDYAGLFGYVSNAIIDGISISDFVIDLYHNNSSAEYLNVGTIAAYISNSSVSSNTIISRCAVTDGIININSKTSSICAGSIVGNVDTANAKVTINNCFSTVDISAFSDSKSIYAGGIAGRMSMRAIAPCIIDNCYSTSQVFGQAHASCFTGGISGYLTSTGSWIETSSDASLSADDADIMVLDSFATGNVVSTGNVNVYTGNITGFANAYAKIQNCYYPVSQTLTATNFSKLPAIKTTVGTKTSIENFRMQTYVSDTVGFDFTSTWKYLRTIPYPVLKIVYDEKPRFSVMSVENTSGTLTANIRVVSPSQNFTVMLAVFDNHGKLLRIASSKFTNSLGVLKEFDLSCLSDKNASLIRISVIDNQTFAPLFKPISKEI